jgi:CSLREA domain-containing protein
VTKQADDDGPCLPDDCALREAVIAANEAPGADTISLPRGEYRLTLEGS